MFELFSHYLSYGATDQQTARDLTGDYDGLLVPGTVAAFQAEGTRGFVQTLNSFKSVPYAIDPRMPLFQQSLPNPKKSHESLAEILGSPELVASSSPAPADFSAERIQNIARAWLEFNSGYTTVSNKHFSKYAQRLGEEVVPTVSTSGPAKILVPYMMAGGVDDPWWAVSRRLWEAHLSEVEPEARRRLVRVVAAEQPHLLQSLLSDCSEVQVAIWANALDELAVSAVGQSALLSYRNAIRSASSEGKQLFALYGGFFAVLMHAFGLRGASHGIGYGEARTWVELPQSGPPPARYYLPLAHRYVSQDLAQYLWNSAPSLAACNCAQCSGRSPGLLDYHELMKHSVHCRAQEIREWVGRSALESSEILKGDALRFRTELASLYLPQNIARQAANCFVHLDVWASVLAAP